METLDFTSGWSADTKVLACAGQKIRGSSRGCEGIIGDCPGITRPCRYPEYTSSYCYLYDRLIGIVLREISSEYFLLVV